MKPKTIEMLKIYKPISNLDWLNYVLVKDRVSFHHIVKREYGGDNSITNGALLMPEAHQYLHIIEYKEIQTYIALNKMFELINKQRHEPTDEQREIIEYLLSSFEEKHQYDKNAKGKSLIRPAYIQRGYKKG